MWNARATGNAYTGTEKEREREWERADEAERREKGWMEERGREKKRKRDRVPAPLISINDLAALISPE